MSLRDLDDKLLPALARRLDHVVNRAPKLPEPTGPLPVIVRLRRLDDRWTRRGPLALFRELPQLAAVLVGLLLFVGFVSARQRTDPDRRRDPARAAEEQPGGNGAADASHLGPVIGDQVPAYLRKAKDDLVLRTAGAPDGSAYAVVAFSTYRTPAEVAALLGEGVQVRKVFYRAPLPIPQTVRRIADVDEFSRDLRKEFVRIAAERESEAKELLAVAATIDDSNENNRAQKEEQERDARIYTREAQILRGPCKCVYSVVVQARFRVLVALLGRPGVRSIDASRATGDLDEYTYEGLLPEEKVTVTVGNQSRF